MLAHSLRDAGTTKKLAVMVTLDSVSAEAITQLKASLEPCPKPPPSAACTDPVLVRVRLYHTGSPHPERPASQSPPNATA